MSFPILQKYLARLSDATGAASSIWLDHEGKAQGRFFNCTMTSAFQPIRQLDSGAVLAYEGLARSVSAQDQGCRCGSCSTTRPATTNRSSWTGCAACCTRLISSARPGRARRLYLNVHDRLLSAVSSNHGHAFRRILDALELPLERRGAATAGGDAAAGLAVELCVGQLSPQRLPLCGQCEQPARCAGRAGPLAAGRVQARCARIAGQGGLAELLQRCAASRVEVVFKRLETPQHLAALRELSAPQVCRCWCRAICSTSRARPCCRSRRGAPPDA
jgi:hypothetical protein